ncbi:MAG TPA: HAD-IIIA family hydrolase [Chitinophagaceae bacterium]|nr:HAD-IIIA family hydrolase [Chitinophagaceae bacterium]
MGVLERLQQVKAFVFDVDGVLTDGALYVFNSGEQVRRMSIKDGFALQLAIKKGYRVIVVSGSFSEAVTSRLNKLGISDVFMKITNKKQKLQEVLDQYGLAWADILFMGDDIPDYTVMKAAGVACAPADAAPEIRQLAHYISPMGGGNGCVREMIEKVLKLHGQWELETDIPSK